MKFSFQRLFVLVLLLCGLNANAQMPKTLPLEFLDKNSSVAYSFNLNETPAQKKAFMDQFTGFLLKEGFNLVKEEVKKNNPTEAEKAQYYKDVETLKISYDVIVILSTKFLIYVYQQDPKSTKQYMGNSFDQAFDAFKKDLALLKEKNPDINKVPYNDEKFKASREQGAEAPKEASTTENTESTDDEEDATPSYSFTEKEVFVNQLPDDLAKSTLIVLLYDEMEVSPEDAKKLEPNVLESRTRRTEKLKNKNRKYKERFADYPYPILFVYSKEVDAAVAKNRYMFVDKYRRAIVEVFTTDSNGRTKIKNKHVIYHNYCIRDNQKPGTYYRLEKWIDCEKGGEIFCTKRFIKGVINSKDE